MSRYKLIGQTPVPCEDLDDWSNFLADNEARRVGLTRVGPFEISTVFLGVDHNWSGRGRPVLFETTVFTGKGESSHCWRCRTWLEAEAQHLRAVEFVQAHLAGPHDRTEQLWPVPLPEVQHEQIKTKT